MNDNTDRKPPVFSGWGGWYRLVLAVALAQFLLYFIITRLINIP